MWMVLRVQLTGLHLTSFPIPLLLLASTLHIIGTALKPILEKVLRCPTREVDEHLANRSPDMGNIPRPKCRHYWTGRAESKPRQRTRGSNATSAARDFNVCTTFVVTCSSTKSRGKRSHVHMLDAARASTEKRILAVMSAVYTSTCESTSASCVGPSLQERIRSLGAFRILTLSPPCSVLTEIDNAGISKAAARNERQWIASGSKTRWPQHQWTRKADTC